MNSTNDLLEMSFKDKQSGEQWECSYEASSIESITKKTGNFKQFDIFVVMLKSGFLKTSSCIALDLLTYEDLESLRTRRLKSNSHHKTYGNNNNNRRYLIVTYSVEFDKVNYPLTLEYCGLPDPAVLQATIRRLERELEKANEKLSWKSKPQDKQYIKALQTRIEELVIENLQLSEQVRHLQKGPVKKSKPQVKILQNAITQLEKNVISERQSHHKLVEKLQNDKMFLAQQIEILRVSEEAMKNKLIELSRMSTQPNKKRMQNTIKSLNSDPFVKMTKAPNLMAHLRSRSASPSVPSDRTWKRRQCGSIPRSKSEESRSSSISSAIRQFSINKKNSSRSESPTMKKIPRSRSISRESVKSIKRQAQHKSRMKRRTGTCKSATEDVEEYEMQIRKLYHNQHAQRF